VRKEKADSIGRILILFVYPYRGFCLSILFLSPDIALSVTDAMRVKILFPITLLKEKPHFYYLEMEKRARIFGD